MNQEAELRLYEAGHGGQLRDAEEGLGIYFSSDHDDANERPISQASRAAPANRQAHQLATREFAPAKQCAQLHRQQLRQRQQQQVDERDPQWGGEGEVFFFKKEPFGVVASTNGGRRGVGRVARARANTEWLNHCAAVPSHIDNRKEHRQHEAASEGVEPARLSDASGREKSSQSTWRLGESGEPVAGASRQDFDCRFAPCSSEDLRACQPAAQPVELLQKEEGQSVKLLTSREHEKSIKATELPGASDIGSLGAAQPLITDNCSSSRVAAIREPPGESSFWRRLSNLSRSIIYQRQQAHHQLLGASTSGHLLAPEVVGYLEKNQHHHCGQDVARAAQSRLEQVSGGMTASEIHEENDKQSAAKSINQSATRRQMKPASRVEGQASETMGRHAIEEQRIKVEEEEEEEEEEEKMLPSSQQAQQQPHNGQRLIKIVEMPASMKMRKVKAEATIEEQQHAAGKLNQIKLSITTTTTNTTTATRSSSGATSLSSCILSDSNSVNSERIKWDKKMDFLLSIIGFAVDLANIWRFPYLVYKNGGGVFLIPYVTMLIFGGIPLFFLELCLGQFVKKGPITVWNKICPYMKGVGYCSILISWYVSFYYNVLIAWSVYFIYRSITSFGDKLPWQDCDNSWNSQTTCVSISQLKTLCATRNGTLEECRKEMFSIVNVTSPASDFFVKELSQIDQSSGLEDMGYLRPELVICTLIVYLLHYCSLFRGLETSGKVVWVTATAPYMILSILLVRGLFLPGAFMGIKYYLSPDIEKLADPQVWIDAAGQVFYSIGVGFGVHLTYASFNSHDNNCYRDCLMTSAINALTSVYSGLVVFVYLGYMATNLGIGIDKVASEGYSLVFEVYPEALTTLPFARFWSILFFIMLLTLGIDSAMGGLEAVITGLEDEFKFAKRLSRRQLTGLVIFSSFLPALISCTQGGAYTLFWFDIYSAGVSLLFSALFETIGVVYCYGLDKFILNIESMLGRKPQLFYILCWKYISPLFLMGIIIMSIYQASQTVPVYRGYTFPLWSIILGWCLAFSSVAAVPIVAIYTLCSNSSKAVSISPSKSPRKPGGLSYSASGSRNSPSKKSPFQAQGKATAVNYSGEATGAIQSSLTGFGQMTTTNIISSPSDQKIKEEML